ncbi:MAG: DUF488 family protein [Armatimonadota bacterium]|nr:DUF488 family protein [Armatimonadota bacterium]MDR7426769.1 DUF488 family protein [Armatimonadota bacterium]MDR7464999.1 DUF488 family protein [Armatimonadota bacterium]MDR7469859.1 DUF488 family protein [Armatimonadota bacterium]MDR7474319.1 DUF488 family protein [Armatimonadota bacterium]
MLRVKRIYELPSPGDGQRFLVERLWARGVSRQEARLAGWLKDLAPSPELRTWFGHDPARWEEFRRRYRAELQAPEKQALLHRLAAAARAGPVTLVYAARDREHNSAVVLREVLEERYLRRRSPAPRAQQAGRRQRAGQAR